MAKKTLTIEEMAVFCKSKGFVYPTAEIYGGLAGFFDYGHLGSEMKKNIKDHWWKTFVQSREDIVGIDGSIITNPKTWVASGHYECFDDIMVECSKCHKRYRGDHLIGQQLKISADGLKKDEINKIILQNKLLCPECKGPLEEGRQFNLMFSTIVGPVADEKARSFLRPETAQLIFTNFKLITEHARLKLPFGIAQMGKAFRNEIAPRDFLFRCREFEQMEIEYFIHPKKANECHYINEIKEHKIFVYSSVMQQQNKDEVKMAVKEALERSIIKTQWHAYWLVMAHKWFISLGADPDKFRIRQHLPTEKSHYAEDTWDLEYKFPFGWKELQGLANRSDFDLKQHMKYSKVDLSLFDEESKEKVIPFVVAEPSQGVDRAFLVFMFDAYNHDPENKERDWIVLKLHPKIAPVKVGIFPLVNKLNDKAKEIYNMLKTEFRCQYDKSAAIGRRYARADENGIPFCVTVDFDTLQKDNKVTIRDRDTTKQKRVLIDDLKCVLCDLIEGRKKFSDI